MAQVNLGNYDVLLHSETPECSFRLLRLSKNRFVHQYHHHKTTQIYFILEGIAEATVSDKTIVLKSHQILRVPIDTLHSIRAEAEALVLSISMPPLDLSDQYLVVER